MVLKRKCKGIRAGASLDRNSAKFLIRLMMETESFQDSRHLKQQPQSSSLSNLSPSIMDQPMNPFFSKTTLKNNKLNERLKSRRSPK